MPHSRNARKRLRQNQKRRLHNRAVKKAIKTQVKKVFSLAESGALDELRKELSLAAKRLDKAAARRVIHPNLAARKKSQLARLLQKKQHAGAAP
jgi:small subunit ribosomal protein S20